LTPTSVRTAPRPPAGWDDFVRSAAGGTFCHHSAWSGIFDRVFGHDYVFAWTEGSHGLDAVLPLVQMPAVPWGRALVSVPYLNYGGAVGSSAGRTALTRWALEERTRRGAKRVELRCRTPVEGEWPTGREKVTVVLDLPGERDELFEDRFRSKLRSQIRRPMKAGMEARFGPEVISDFYDVFATHMRDLGTPVLPVELFLRAQDAFGDDALFVAIYHEGTPVAGGGGFVWGDEFEITWASSLREYSRQAPNMLLYWSLMERMIERGVGAFNFGRCTPGGGTHRFKSQWGGDDEPLAWIGVPESEGEDDGEEDDGAFDAARRLWQKLPVPVANLLGPALARRIPRF